MTWEDGELLSLRSSPFPAQALSSYRNRAGRGFFSLSHYLLLAFGVLRPCPSIFLAFGALSVRTSAGAIVASGGDPPPMLPVYSNKHMIWFRDRGMTLIL